MPSVNEKVCLVTGGAQGLGKAFTEILLRNGAKVGVADIKQVQGEATTKQLQQKYGKDRVTFIKCDVTSQEDMENAFLRVKSTFNGLDLVVNNAGILDERKWDEVINVDLTAVIRGTLLGISHMSRENGGNGGIIFNMGSIAGLETNHFVPSYVAAKHGVVAYTRSWARNPKSASMGLRFHSLCPSFADTDMIAFTDESVYDCPNLEKMMEEFGTLSREKVAEAFLDLVTSESHGDVLTVTEKLGQRSVTEPTVFQ